jgi:hypothetical protein
MFDSLKTIIIISTNIIIMYNNAAHNNVQIIKALITLVVHVAEKA